MKRIFELTTGDIERLSKNELKDIIKNSEGRTVMAETIISYTPYVKEVSNLELAASFGADMITLNTFNFEKPYIFGFGEANLSKGLEDTFRIVGEEIKNNIKDKNYIRNIRKLVGRLIGVNLEPVPEGSTYEMGYRLNKENLEKVKEYGFNYIVITGNPSTGVTEETICEGIKLAKDILGDSTLIIAGKMHGAGYGFNYIVITGNPSTGVTEETICEGIKLAKDILGDSTLIIAGKMHGAGSGNIYDEKVTRRFVKCGADVVLIPAPGTVPGVTEEIAKKMIDSIHEEGGVAMTTIGTSQEGSSESVIEKIALMSKMAGADIQHIGDCGTFGMALGGVAMTTIGTSQEGSSESVIEKIALMSKMAGADIQHIGDCGTFGMALPENIMKLSVTIRGIRHTYRRMAQSIRR